jgi:hypothetical protein
MSRIPIPRISKAELLDAISRGVADAIWRVATNATQAPCADFFASIEDGVAIGVERFHKGENQQ